MTPHIKESSLGEGQEKVDIVIEHGLKPGHVYETDLFDLSCSWKVIQIIKTKNSYEVFAELLTPPPVCPNCGRSDLLNPSGTLAESMADQQIHDLYVALHFIRQRYKCACGRNLLQPLADNFKKHSVTTRAALQLVKDVMLHSYAFGAEKICRTPKAAKNIFADFICDMEAAREVTFPEVIGIDGVCVGRRKHKRSYSMITDLSNHRILDLLGKSTELELARFLKQVPGANNLKIVVIDMAIGFRVVIQKLFPQVIIVIDPYHVLRLLNDAVTEAVKLKQISLSEAERKELMRGGNRFLLLKRRSELCEEEKKQLELWFERVPEFKHVYDLKEEIFDIWRIKERAEAEKRYDEWLKKLPAEFEKPFRKFTGAVRRWREFVFNYFDYRFTNAYTESRNRDVKTLQRQGRRTSFPVLRARLLYADLLLRPVSPHNKIRPSEVREVVRKARKSHKPARTRDPHSYVARIDAARKSKNEFSRLLRPPCAWQERFGHYSNQSEESSPFKWDFLW